MEIRHEVIKENGIVIILTVRSDKDISSDKNRKIGSFTLKMINKISKEIDKIVKG